MQYCNIDFDGFLFYFIDLSNGPVSISGITYHNQGLDCFCLYSNGFLLGFNDPSRSQNHLLEN